MNAVFTVGMQFYCRKSILLHEMNYICNNYIFTAVNKLLLKYAFLRNVLKKSTPHLASLSSLYTIGGDQCKKKLALGHYTKKVI
jgi:hypothetical protein